MLDAKNPLIAALVVSTLVLGVLAASESAQVSSLRSETSVASDTVTSTITPSPYATTTTSSCTATGGIGCPHFFNQTWTISLDYSGPWGLTYQGYLGDSASTGTLVDSGDFFGHGPGTETVRVTGISEVGVTLCAQAHKLDGSNSTLVVRVSSATNQTALAFGVAQECIADVIM